VRVLSAIKSLVFPEGRVPRRILAGAFADLVMQLDLRNQSQLYVGAFEREIQPWLRLRTAQMLEQSTCTSPSPRYYDARARNFADPGCGGKNREL
jgi:hypothetical protein